MPDSEFERHFKVFWRSGTSVELIDSTYDGYFELKTISLIDGSRKTKTTTKLLDENQRGAYKVQEKTEHRVSNKYLLSSYVTEFWRDKMHSLRGKLVNSIYFFVV